MGCATQGEKAAIIKELREKGYQLKCLLQEIGMAKSTYYYLVNKEETDFVAIRNEPVLKDIKIIFIKNKGLYGVRRVHNEVLK